MLAALLDPEGRTPGSPIVDTHSWLDDGAPAPAQVAAAFLVTAAGAAHPQHAQAVGRLGNPPPGAERLAAFYRVGLERVARELARVFARAPGVAARWDEAQAALEAARSREEVEEAAWRAFFPQAVGARGHELQRIATIRAARTIIVDRLAPDPIEDPTREVLFTSNVLLTLPAANTDLDALPYPADLRQAIQAASHEPQRTWFDHPIQIGVEPAANELLYGLRGLDDAVAAEGPGARVTCLLSVSVTHHGLAPIAGRYVEAELARVGRLEHVDVVVVTDQDAGSLLDEAIVPALGELGDADARALRRAIGVDGRYGRHYSFLKAIAALWAVAVDPAIRATFKIDLDQVFPQPVLRRETGRSLFGHLRTPLWGATARAADGRALDLGMLAGALVNERDIGEGLFTPDVPLPTGWPAPDELVFFSRLPQAISTRAEMMERYDGPIDGLTRALERVHVTGGTNGIRIDALRRHRPFTPSWVGRAEDQAYLLSVLDGRTPRLAYAHAAGLIMRHDKEAFAGQAMAAAHIGKLIGDDERILVFSAYAEALATAGTAGPDIQRLLDPFTGCFISPTPLTVVLLRHALRTLRLAAEGPTADAVEYATDGAARLAAMMQSHGDPAIVAADLAQERAAWDRYYDALDGLEAGSAALRAAAGRILQACRVGPAGR